MKALDQFVFTMSTESIGFPDKQLSDIQNRDGKISVSGIKIIGLVVLVLVILISTFLMNHFSTEDKSSSEEINSTSSISDVSLADPHQLQDNSDGRADNGSFWVPANTSSSNTKPILGSSIMITNSNRDQNKTSTETLMDIYPRNVLSLCLENMNSSKIENNIFDGMVDLTTLCLENGTLEYIHLEFFQSMSSMKYLSLRNNKLTLNYQSFPILPLLSELYLDNNSITTITVYTFTNVFNVHLLSLSYNSIKVIAEEAFQHLLQLKELNICHNNIFRLNPETFAYQKQLKRLCLGNNPLAVIPNHCFKNLVDLEYLNLEEVQIDDINTSMFESLQNLKLVKFKSYYYCHYVPDQENCLPSTDGISSSTNLLSKPMFRYWNWMIAAVICIGNILVVFNRLLCKDDNQMLSLVIRNLAVSDFLMGVYLLIIGIQDVKYRDRYNEVIQEWRSSWECTVTGIVGMISSEVTVCFLVFISVDRFLMITSPLRKTTLQNKKNALTIVGIIWFMGIMIAIVPVIRYVNDNRFYGVNGLCFPLHIGNPFFIGWQYSAVIIFGLNATSLIIIAVVYIAMFISIWKTRNATSLPRQEYEFVIRFFFIVFIYTICWLPIIILKATLFFREISDEFYAWLIIFVLPINSASNPILYTFTSPKFTEKIKKSFTMENNFDNNNENISRFGISSEVEEDIKFEKDDLNQVKIIINRF